MEPFLQEEGHQPNGYHCKLKKKQKTKRDICDCLKDVFVSVAGQLKHLRCDVTHPRGTYATRHVGTL